MNRSASLHQTNLNAPTALPADPGTTAALPPAHAANAATEAGPPSEPELQVLAHVHQNRAAKQRDIAHAIGLSLGMTNAILKRLAEKGFVTLRRVNARNVHYLVTPTGVDQITRRSYRYVRRTVGHVVRYKQILTEFCRHHQQAGARSIILVGESDLAFLVEWCAHKTGLTFEQHAAPAAGKTGPSAPATGPRAPAAGPPAAAASGSATTVTLLSEQLPAPDRAPARTGPDGRPGLAGPAADGAPPEAEATVHLADLLVAAG